MIWNVVDPIAQVEVVFNPGPSNQLEARFGCVPCGEWMVWEKEGHNWVCPECTFDMTPGEADIMVRRALRALKTLRGFVKGKKNRWDWVIWWRKPQAAVLSRRLSKPSIPAQK